ncbi:MAG: transposase [Planctomycetota bacterium]
MVRRNRREQVGHCSRLRGDHPQGPELVGGATPTVPRPRAGAVAFVQRFDSGLRLNVHFHVLWLDGVYGWEPGRGAPVFAEQREVTDADVQKLVSRIRDRVLRALRKAGKWVVGLL